jgi:hypothetical protein
MKNLTQIQAASTAELIAFYNLHNADKPVKKFTNRETAERRVLVLVEELANDEAMETMVEKEAPKHVPIIIRAPKDAVVDHSASNKLIGDMLAREKAEAKSKPEVAAEKKTEEKPELVAPVDPAKWATKGRASNSAGVAASWADPEVAAARRTRDGVHVVIDGEGMDFKSVNEAFHHYRLPVSKHIRFRLKLKSTGAEVFEFAGKKYSFTIVRLAVE